MGIKTKFNPNSVSKNNQAHEIMQNAHEISQNAHEIMQTAYLSLCECASFEKAGWF
jgi:hypothetical protein